MKRYLKLAFLLLAFALIMVLTLQRKHLSPSLQASSGSRALEIARLDKQAKGDSHAPYGFQLSSAPFVIDDIAPTDLKGACWDVKEGCKWLETLYASPIETNYAVVISDDGELSSVCIGGGPGRMHDFEMRLVDLKAGTVIDRQGYIEKCTSVDLSIAVVFSQWMNRLGLEMKAGGVRPFDVTVR